MRRFRHRSGHRKRFDLNGGPTPVDFSIAVTLNRPSASTEGHANSAPARRQRRIPRSAARQRTASPAPVRVRPASHVDRHRGLAVLKAVKIRASAPPMVLRGMTFPPAAHRFQPKRAGITSSSSISLSACCRPEYRPEGADTPLIRVDKQLTACGQNSPTCSRTSGNTGRTADHDHFLVNVSDQRRHLSMRDGRPLKACANQRGNEIVKPLASDLPASPQR